jgi:ABC-type transporter lipoprotein component MlaA
VNLLLIGATFASWQTIASKYVVCPAFAGITVKEPVTGPLVTRLAVTDAPGTTGVVRSQAAVVFAGTF